MAFNIGILVEKNIGDLEGKTSVTSGTGRSGFREVEQIDLAEGWQQLVAGTWRGIGLLDVQEALWHIWGRQIILVEPGTDRRKLQAHYPGQMVFTPAEFMDAVEHWPENEGVMLAKRIFNGDIQGVHT